MAVDPELLPSGAPAWPACFSTRSLNVVIIGKPGAGSNEQLPRSTRTLVEAAAALSLPVSLSFSQQPLCFGTS